MPRKKVVAPRCQHHAVVTAMLCGGEANEADVHAVCAPGETTLFAYNELKGEWRSLARVRIETRPVPPQSDRPRDLIVIDERGTPRPMRPGGSLGPAVGPPCPEIPFIHIPGCYHNNPPAPVPNAAPTPLEADPTPTSRQDKADASLEPPPEPTPPPPAKAPRPQVASSAPDAEPLVDGLDWAPWLEAS
jgi:hypothetical protein